MKSKQTWLYKRRSNPNKTFLIKMMMLIYLTLETMATNVAVPLAEKATMISASLAQTSQSEFKLLWRVAPVAVAVASAVPLTFQAQQSAMEMLLIMLFKVFSADSLQHQPRKMTYQIISFQAYRQINTRSCWWTVKIKKTPFTSNLTKPTRSAWPW